MELKNKKAKLSLDMIIIIILAILIIFFIVFLIFGNNISDWFRNLPGYSYDDEDRIVENLPGDVGMIIKYYKVAVVQEGKNIMLCSDGDCSKLKDSNLYFGTFSGEEDGDIYVKQEGWFGWDKLNPDDYVGNIYKKVVYIHDEVLENPENISGLPSKGDLENLNGATYISGILYQKEKKE